MGGRPNRRNKAAFQIPPAWSEEGLKPAWTLYIFDSFCFFVFSPGDISKQFSDADEVQAEVAKVKFS